MNAIVSLGCRAGGSVPTAWSAMFVLKCSLGTKNSSGRLEVF